MPPSTQPTGAYSPFIPFLFIPMLVALVVYTDVSVVCVVRDHMVTYLYEINTAYVTIMIYYFQKTIMIYLQIKPIRKLLIYLAGRFLCYKPNSIMPGRTGQ